MNTRKAFTLVELLTVILLIVLISALTLPAIQGSNAAKVTTTGSRIAGLLESARQTAITTRTPVAVALLAGATQRLTALKYVPTTGTNGTWQQISKWESFPSGIVTDCNALLTGSGTPIMVTGTTFAAFQPTNSPDLGANALPTLKYSATTYQPRTDYGYVIFQADGTLYNAPKPCILRIVQGTNTTAGGVSTTTYQALKRDASGVPLTPERPANYFDIIVTSPTGQIKIARPEDE